MPSSDVGEEITSRHRLIELGVGAGWLIGASAGVQLIGQILGVSGLGTAVVGAIVADAAAGRVGVRWGERHVTRAALRLAGGALVALVLGTTILTGACFAGWLRSHGGGVHPSSALAFALVRSSAIAVRDELLYRGIPLAVASRAQIPPSVAKGYAALAGAAAISLSPSATIEALVLAAAAGWLFATLWEKDRGPWAAVGAHTVWVLILGSVVHGGLFDLDWSSGKNLASDGSAAGAPAWVSAVVLVGAAVSLRWWNPPGIGRAAIARQSPSKSHR